MPSILQKALGPGFARLHPRIQQQYSLTSADHRANLGRGVMDEVWHGRFYMWPFLWLGSLRNIFFTETGRDVTFTIANYAFIDELGRETLTWTREFALARVRRFDETMIYHERLGRIVVYAGTHQHLAVELHARVDDAGALCLQTGRQWVYVRGVPFGIRYPRLFSGDAFVREWFDDAAQQFGIDVRLESRLWGRIFGYRGKFTLEQVPCTPEQVPEDVRPRRYNPRPR